MKTILVDAVYCFIIEGKEGKFEIFKDMYELLETYPNKKIIISGASGDKFEEYCLNKLPYEFFTLKHNPEKTNPKYFEILLEKFGLNINDVVYFEHNIDAIKSAESIGIKSYFYDNDKKDLETLKKFLDENLK